MQRLIVGCGYVGERVARRWAAQGDAVIALTRAPEKAARLATLGITPLVGALGGEAALPPLPRAIATVLVALGDDRSGTLAPEVWPVATLTRVLAWIADAAAAQCRVLLVSTTGVYGEAAPGDEAWTDETTPTAPARATARGALAAEQMLESSAHGARAVVLRLAGLYGPGRVPRLADVRAGRVDGEPDGPLNLIHGDDAAAVIVAAAERAAPRALYVVADGAPATRRAYCEAIARLVGVAAPTFSTPSGAERHASGRRFRSDKMRLELGITLRYPSYREGLAQALAP